MDDRYGAVTHAAAAAPAYPEVIPRSRGIEATEVLQAERQELGEQLSLDEELVFEKNSYWKKKEDGGLGEGPFCPCCLCQNDTY